MAYTITPGTITLPDTIVADLPGAYQTGAKAQTDITKAEEQMRIAQIQREQDQQRIGLEARRVGLAERTAAQARAEAARQRAAAQEEGRAGIRAMEGLTRGLTAPVPTAPAAAPSYLGGPPAEAPLPSTYTLGAPFPGAAVEAAPPTPTPTAVAPPVTPFPGITSGAPPLGAAQAAAAEEAAGGMPPGMMRAGLSDVEPTAAPAAYGPPSTLAATAPATELQRLRDIAASTTAPVAQTRQAAAQAEQFAKAEINRTIGALTKEAFAGNLFGLSGGPVPYSRDARRGTMASPFFSPDLEAAIRADDEKYYPQAEINARAAQRQQFRDMRAWAQDPKTVKYLSENPEAFDQFITNPTASYPALKTLPATVGQSVAQAAKTLAKRLAGGDTGVETPENKGYYEELLKRFKPTGEAVPSAALPSNSPLPPSRAIVEAEAYRAFFMDRAKAMYQRMARSGVATAADHKAALDLVTAAANANAVRTNAMLAHGLDMSQQGNTSYLSQVVSQLTGTPTKIERDAFNMYTVQATGLPPKTYPSYEAFREDMRLRFDATYQAQKLEADKAARAEQVKFEREKELEKAKAGFKNPDVKVTPEGNIVVTEPLTGRVRLIRPKPVKKEGEIPQFEVIEEPIRPRPSPTQR